MKSGGERTPAGNVAWLDWLGWIPGLSKPKDDGVEDTPPIPLLGNGLALTLGQQPERPKTHHTFADKYLVRKNEPPATRSAYAHPDLEPAFAWERDIPENAKVPAAGLILAPDLQNNYSTGFTVVADFMESSPAYRCGLIRIGDRITKVDGVSIFGRTIADISARLRGREGSTVVISFVDARTDRPYTVRLVRRRTASMHSPALTEGLHAQVLPPHRQSGTTRRSVHSYDHAAPLTPQEMWREANEIGDRPLMVRAQIEERPRVDPLSLNPLPLPTSFRFV